MNWTVGWVPDEGYQDIHGERDDALAAFREQGPGGGWIPVQCLRGGHEDAVIRAKFSPDGRLAASCSKDATLRVFDLETKRRIAVCRGHTKGINDFDWFHGGADGSHTVFTASSDSSLRCFDLREPSILTKEGCAVCYESCHAGPCMGVTCPKFTGQYFISGGYDECVKKWDVRRACSDVGRVALQSPSPLVPPLVCLKAHQAPISSVELSFDDQVIVTSSLDGSARLWDSNFEALRTFVVDQPVPCVHATLSPNGLHLLCITPPHSRQRHTLPDAQQRRAADIATALSPVSAADRSAISPLATTVASPPAAAGGRRQDAPVGAIIPSASHFTTNCALFETYGVHRKRHLVLPHPLSAASRRPHRFPCASFPSAAPTSGTDSRDAPQPAAAFCEKPYKRTLRSAPLSKFDRIRMPCSMVFGTFWRDKVMVPVQSSERASDGSCGVVEASDCGAGVHVWDGTSAVHLTTIAPHSIFLEGDKDENVAARCDTLRQNAAASKGYFLGKGSVATGGRCAAQQQSSTTSVSAHPKQECGLILTTSAGVENSTVVWMYQGDECFE